MQGGGGFRGGNQGGGGFRGGDQGGGRPGREDGGRRGDRGGNDRGGNDRGGNRGGNDRGGNNRGGNDRGGNNRGGNDRGGNDRGGQQQKPEPVVVDAADLTEQDLGLSTSSRARRLSSLFELVNTQVRIPSEGERDPDRIVNSPLNDPGKLKDQLPLLFDKTTTSRNTDLPSRVNVNTAPRAVLLALPGMTDADVEAILAARPDPDSAQAPGAVYQTPAWLLTEADLPVNTLRTLERFVTARTQVYRVQAVGHFERGGPTIRVEAVIDTNRGRPRIVYWRDLTELGKGFALPGASGP
jgi:Type II secretion system (T2SS), protein K